jgi:protein tyrosine/serine phosphatase
MFLFLDYIGGLGKTFLCCLVMFQLCIQEPFVNIPQDTIREALQVVLGNASTSKLSYFIPDLINCYKLRDINIYHFIFVFNADVKNHPILIHCKRGKVCPLLVS